MSNCWLFAWAFYWRLKAKGREPYFSSRASRNAPCPHYLIMWRMASGYVHTVSFKPVEPIKRRFPPLLFRGRVEWGDWADTVAER